MSNCPPAGKWSIAVWEGQGGTATADALATCGSGAVDAAYSLDPQTGSWSRWFAGKPDVSNLPPFSDMQGVLALGPAIAAAPTPVASPTPVATATPTGTATPSPTPTPTSGEPELGTWSGTTSQGKPFEFDVVEGSRAIARLRFEYEGTCGGGCTCEGDVETNFTVPMAIVNNTFSHTGSRYDVSGEFDSATTASGDLSYDQSGYGPYDPGCDSGPMTWTASLQ